jgi:hypothetical protein
MERARQWLTLTFGILALVFFGYFGFFIFDIVRSKNSPETHCRAAMTGFVMGLKAYHTEYNRYPAEAISTTPSQTRGKIMITLHPDQNAFQPPEGNSRKINFYDPPPDRGKGVRLYYDEKKEPIFVDSWGTPFYFVVSPDDKKEIPNPDRRDRQQNPKIEASIIMFSAGPDQNPDTWEDNIMSWK